MAMTTNLETKATKADFSVDHAQRVISGYAAIFGNVDAGNDVIHRGAFAKTIAERMPKNQIKVLWMHDQMKPIGMPIKLEEDSTGLAFEAKISKTQIGDEALTLIADGVVDSMSIGYKTIKFDHEQKGSIRVRNIREARLGEISPLTWGLNPLAKITGVKGALDALNDAFGDDAEKIGALLNALNEQRAGRVLSAKNRDLIGKAVDALSGARDALDALLQATDAATEPGDKSTPHDGKGDQEPHDTKGDALDPDYVQSIIARIRGAA